MEAYIKLLLQNKIWAAEKLEDDPEYFKNLAKDQSPDYLWIGCSDSRVPAEDVIGAQPGELFVHRNIANLVVHTDLNLLGVLQYAVDVLKVKHVIVCGHYGCGGVRAAYSQADFGMLNNWLRNIKDVYRLHNAEMANYHTDEERLDRLVELSVKEQVMNLAKTSIIQHAWKNDQRPYLHGWVYGLKDGILQQVFEMAPGTGVDEIYEYRS